MKTILITENQFENLVNNLLNEDENIQRENIINKLKKTFPKIKEEDFNKIIENDPTKQLEYSFWLLKQYNDILKHKITDIRPDQFIEDLYKTKDDLNTYHKIKHNLSPEQKNINILNYKQLYDIIKPYLGKERELISKGEQKRMIKSEEADLIYEDNKWFVVHPKTEQGSCTYGKGTRWCVAATESQNMFKSYSSHGKFYFVLNKQNPKDKYAFFFDSDANKLNDLLWNSEDKNISADINKFFKDKKQLLNVFYKIGQDNHQWKFLLTIGFPNWIDYVDPNLTTLELNSLNINKLPENIGKLTNLFILRAMNNNLATIPESIGNLKNLVSLGISRNNIVKLPKSIGKLKKLEELLLTYNNLTFLPLEINNLINMEALYLGENPNLKNIYQVIKKSPGLKKLQYLIVENTQIDKKEIQMLQKLLPNTKIR